MRESILKGFATSNGGFERFVEDRTFLPPGVVEVEKVELK